MPTVQREGPYRFHVYSNEYGEPPHIHVQRDRAAAKFWLQPVRVAGSVMFSLPELRVVETIVRRNETRFVEAWHDFFGE